MEQSNNPLIEQFQKEFASQGNSASRESWNSIPMILFRTAAVAGWTNIISQINSTESVSCKESGIQLCTFAVDIMANDIDANLKISEVTLDLGVECLKSLLETNIDTKCNVSAEQKEKENEKRIGKEFLVFWKEWLKNALKQEGRLS